MIYILYIHNIKVYTRDINSTKNENEIHNVQCMESPSYIIVVLRDWSIVG